MPSLGHTGTKRIKVIAPVINMIFTIWMWRNRDGWCRASQTHWGVGESRNATNYENNGKHLIGFLYRKDEIILQVGTLAGLAFHSLYENRTTGGTV